MNLASFDIFDTVLLRKCGEPNNIFTLLAQYLYPFDEDKRNDFVAWRKRAPLKMLKQCKKTELNICDIYSDTDVQAYDEYLPEEIAQKEIEIEKENWVINPEIYDIIKKKRNAGYDIAFISDMYIDKTNIYDFLARNGCAEKEDHIFISCEVQARKDNGALFDYVRALLKPQMWEHYGDNKNSDIIQARKKGIEAHHIKTEFNSLEMKLCKAAHSSSGIGELSILAGISRAVRIQHKKDSFAAIAANYVASAYIPFVIDTIEKAKKEGIKTLYFLSRDSYILQKIAESLPPSGIEYKYLFASRRSLMRSFLSEGNADDYISIADRQTLIGRKIDHLLWQLQISEEILKKRYGIGFSYKRITCKEEEKDFINKIFNSRFTNDFKNEAKENLRTLLEYLKQEGLTDSKKSAIVDVGWLGTSRYMINAILRRNGFSPIKFIYYGTRSDVYNYRFGAYSSYITTGILNTSITSIIENYYSASPYPTTVGYVYEGDGIKPQFPKGQEIAFSKIVLSNVEITKYITKEICKFKINNTTALKKWAEITLTSISDLSDKPDISPFAYSKDFDEECFVKKMGVSEIIKYAFMGKRITHFDQASVAYTLGYQFLPILVKLHKFTSRIRGIIFRRFIIK